jgi:hypothetical protein
MGLSMSNTLAQDARALLAVRLGNGEPLVPASARNADPRQVIAAGLEALAELRRRRQRAFEKPHWRRQSTEAE